MKLAYLELKNFRNYASLSMELDSGVNLIVGDNAQGKTNLLEAVVYLSQGSSYRTRKEEELIRWNQDFARLEAGIQGTDRETELVYALFRGSRRRQIMKNGVKQKSAAGTEGILTTVLFCPEDLQLLRAGAAVRRRFLDSAISQLRRPPPEWLRSDRENPERIPARTGGSPDRRWNAPPACRPECARS